MALDLILLIPGLSAALDDGSEVEPEGKATTKKERRTEKEKK